MEPQKMKDDISATSGPQNGTTIRRKWHSYMERMVWLYESENCRTIMKMIYANNRAAIYREMSMVL